MKKVLIIMIALTLLIFSISGCKKDEDNRNNGSSNEVLILKKLINNEYRLLEHYKMAKNSLKNPPPFLTYYKEQEMRIEMLLKLYEKHDKNLPKNSYENQLPGFKNIQNACKTSYDLEKNAQALYQSLLTDEQQPVIKNYVENFMQKSNSRTSFLKMCSNSKN